MKIKKAEDPHNFQNDPFSKVKRPGGNNIHFIIAGTIFLIAAAVLLYFFVLNKPDHYAKGTENLRQRNYDQALTDFQKVTPDNDNFRKAQSKINFINGLDSYNKKKFDEAKLYFDKVDSYDEYYNEVKLMLDKMAMEEKSKKIEENLSEMDAKLKSMEVKMLNDKEKESYNRIISAGTSRSLCGDYPEASLRYLMYSDISGRSKQQLRIMRNEIFMRRGYIFKSDDLRNYFNRFPCYTPRYSDVTGMLSDVEKQNANFIKQYE